jgi:hypothetical protein
MSCITQLLEMKGDKEILPFAGGGVIEGGGNYRGYEYIITFVELGHRCGYVAYPEGTLRDYQEIECHGGITFTGRDHHAKDLLPVHCDDLWLGFDAAHGWDSKCLVTSEKYFGQTDSIKALKSIYCDLYEPIAEHRNYEYMENQCHKIIDQLKDNK